ncbi:MAG: Holliday junction resolvase RuvX [Candidatus Bruticola sp.]
MRVLGIDLGEKRIGLAISDPMGIIASPYDVWEGRDRDGLPGRIRHLVEERSIGLVVVGLPNRTDRLGGEKAEYCTAFAKELQERLTVPVELMDERLTTVMAHQAMSAGGVKEKKRRQSVDKIAAVLILQSWLDKQNRPINLDPPEWNV